MIDWGVDFFFPYVQRYATFDSFVILYQSLSQKPKYAPSFASYKATLLYDVITKADLSYLRMFFKT